METDIAIVIALVAGLLFGAGLIVSGMVSPAKVLGFLDLFDQWDLSLALIMAGAIAVGVIAFFVTRRRGCSWLGMPIQLPSATGVAAQFVLGSAVFSIGWGLAGFCPGPALVALGAGVPKAVGFAAAMLVGIAVFSWLQRKRQAGGSATSKPITHLQRTA